MISSADLFTFTLLATGVLYACLLAYFKKFTSAHRLELRAYPLDHYTAAYILNRIQNRSDRRRGRAGCLIGTGNLMVIYIYLVIELSRHDLPKNRLLGHSGIIVDFGTRRIEDHGFRSDLRVVSSNSDQSLAVRVSNDARSWELCEPEDKILTDWDVLYFNSPWRYVRVTNKSDQYIQISEVYDLD